MDPQKLSTQELVQRCLQEKDESLWTEFVRRFQPFIAGVIAKRASRSGQCERCLVEDLAQDTFLKLCTNNFKALRNFKFPDENPEAYFHGFLKTIASHVAEDYFRSASNAKRGGGQKEESIDDALPSQHPASIHTPDSEIMRSEIEDCLTERVGEPTFERDCRIFWLYYQDGYTANDISQQPEIKLGIKGVESTLLRLTRHIRGRLGRPHPNPSQRKKLKKKGASGV